MKRNSNIFEFATKLIPVRHERYRQMSSLAALGQLGGPEMCELNEHISACAACRIFLEQTAQASVQVFPVLAEVRLTSSAVTPPAGMRARFLSRLEQEAEKPDHSDALIAPLMEVPQPATLPRQAEANLPSGTGSKARYWQAGLGMAAALALAITGFYLGKLSTKSNATVTQIETHGNLPSAPIPVGETSDRLQALVQEKDALQRQFAEAKAKLSTSETLQNELSAELNEANRKLQELTAGQQAKLRVAGEHEQQSQNELALLRNQVDSLRKQADGASEKLAEEQKGTQFLRTKLEVTEANLQQEMNLKDAKSQMGDLVAARNLHIVDVYDSDPSGKRQRAFGRVFYTEGKSLVFYAYDLEDAKQAKANVVFHVWGGKAGVKEVTHRLGILHKDSDGDSRWKMTFDDSNVLAEINTVFVTAESAGKTLDSPKGKKVLYAYFGSAPNHP